ncbi:MAG: hypothetical protein U9N59_01510 [Campylobacterota bacterium]|nr:hypothetical protein [Campylobacterota bacterium]
MKFLKSLLAFVLPLILVLITFSAYIMISNTIVNYKQLIINDYAIMVVANKPLVKNDVMFLKNVDVKDIENLKREDIVENLKDELPKNSLDQLKENLPYFYKIYLVDYPTSSELKYIEDELEKLSQIKRVETFSSDHSKIYSLLLLNGQISKVILMLISLFTLFILMKQVKIWFIEHDRRITIIQYYGGSIFYGAMPIIRLAVLSFIIASIVAICLNSIIVENLSYFLTPEIINIMPKNQDMTMNYISIFVVSFLISSISVIGVLIKHKIK